MSNIYLMLAGALAVLMIFHGGRVYERGLTHEAQIEQFKEDAVEVAAIGDADREAKVRIVERVRTVDRLVPMDDCYHRPMPAAVLNGLRGDTGIRTGHAPDGGLPAAIPGR